MQVGNVPGVGVWTVAVEFSSDRGLVASSPSAAQSDAGSKRHSERSFLEIITKPSSISPAVTVHSHKLAAPRAFTGPKGKDMRDMQGHLPGFPQS